ncbi:MAG: D-sedoheptulose 7-phosphate isomerase [Candidatus Competibacteraceae bacterium]
MNTPIIDEIDRYFSQHLEVAQRTLVSLHEPITRAAEAIVAALKNGNKLLLCGNGGSAADAQHIAAELTGRYLSTTRRPLPAIALTTDTSALTAIGNDFGFDSIFARQVEALTKKGDVLLGISTSGKSPNVAAAITAAKACDCRTIGLLGRNGGPIAELVDVAIIVPSNETPHIQEMHITIGHLFCGIVDKMLS